MPFAQFRTEYNRHSRALHRQGKFLGLVKCPHCDVRGGLWQAHDSGATGWDRYCYFCSYRDVVPRRMEVEEQRVASLAQIKANEQRIRELERVLGLKENTTMGSWKI
jgi:hypothetical protein